MPFYFLLWANSCSYCCHFSIVDFHICTNLQQHLALDPEAQRVMRSGAAVVLPAFEYVEQDEGYDSATFPKNKEALIQLVQEKKITTFHDFFPKGHNATDYERWYVSDAVYKVTTYQHSYEPYVILRKEGTPWCDERFVGYGANKAVSIIVSVVQNLKEGSCYLPDDPRNI